MKQGKNCSRLTSIVKSSSHPNVATISFEDLSSTAEAVLQYICSPGTRGSLWQWPLSWSSLWSVMVMSTSDAGAGGGGRAGCSLVAAAVAVVGQGAIIVTIAAPAMTVQNYY